MSNDLTTKRICHSCIGDDALRALVQDELQPRAECSYCGARKKHLTMSQLADCTADTLREYCCRGEEIRVFRGDNDSPDYEQEGESLDYLLEEELQVPSEAAEDLASILYAMDEDDSRDGGDEFFSSEQSYHRAYLHPWEYHEAWEEFTYRIKHSRRFFDLGAQQLIARILGAPGDQKARTLPILKLGPKEELIGIYRARRARNEDEARRFLKNAPTQLGPPPPRLASAGRMNPAGISVFYGALSAETAVAELRPSVADIVVYAEFRPRRVLRLLDLPRIHIAFSGSLFESGYEDRASRRRFLEGFHSLISQPIRRGDETLEYLPTQAIAEYVANVLGLDGVLYASAQVGATPEPAEPKNFVLVQDLTPEELARHNVVLFGSAARVVNAKHNEPGKRRKAILRYVKRSGLGVTVSAVNYSSRPTVFYNPDWTPHKMPKLSIDADF
jgi:hypothetical protein